MYRMDLRAVPQFGFAEDWAFGGLTVDHYSFPLLEIG
jgi:hypothetical protein